MKPISCHSFHFNIPLHNVLAISTVFPHNQLYRHDKAMKYTIQFQFGLGIGT